jgi:hypothetical protein
MECLDFVVMECLDFVVMDADECQPLYHSLGDYYEGINPCFWLRGKESAK